MSKDSVADWDATAANNTDIGGINIGEGMVPSAVNNAMREKMAQIAELFGTDVAFSAAQQTQFRTNIGAELLGGFRNLLLNPLGTINQRGYTSGTATSAANQYTLDRWRVVTSGQSLSWSESEGVRTLTAPAGGVEQVIEGSAILTGNHVLTWEGSASATVGGVSRTSGEVFSLTGGTNVTVRFTNGTFSKPQLERSSSATVFSCRHIQQELALCQRYYETGTEELYTMDYRDGNSMLNVSFRVRKRGTPTVALVSAVGTLSAGGVKVDGFYASGSSIGAVAKSIGGWSADAEL